MNLYAIATLAVTQGAEMSLDESAWFALTGFAVVLISLTLLFVFCSLMGVLFRAIAARGASVPRAKVAQADGDMTAEQVAVIAAAVATVLDKPHRIVHIRGLTPEDLEWTLEGRFLHHTSHNPARRGR